MELQQEGYRIGAPAGHSLFDVGSPCEAYIFLTSGTMRVIKPGRNGREILLYRLQAGDSCILTVACMLGHMDYPARGIAETNLTYVSIPEHLFDQLVIQSSEFRQFMFRFFAYRITYLMELIEDVAWRQLDRRLAVVMLSKGERIQVTHQMLANEVGSVREVVSRILKDFESQGLLKLGRGQIQILDKTGLQQVAFELSDPGH